MKSFHGILIITVLAIVFGGCKRESSPDHANVNLEQINRPGAHHILAPGMGTIGLIKEGEVRIFYFDDQGLWMEDTASRFNIPEKNRGIMAMGMGTFAVREGNSLCFYRMNAFNEWQKEDYLTFDLPPSYDKLVAMKMPWEIGVIGVEKDGAVDFHYFYDDDWQHDPSATFVIPSGITTYHPLGDMTIAIADNEKLGLYFLTPDDGWAFMDDDALVLLLPPDYEAIMAFDRNKLAVLASNSLKFFGLELAENRWVRHTDLEFDLPF